MSGSFFGSENLHIAVDDTTQLATIAVPLDKQSTTCRRIRTKPSTPRTNGKAAPWPPAVFFILQTL